MLWTMPLALPLMEAVQEMCARIGRVTGKGLAANIKAAFPAPVLKIVVVLLLVANTLNIAADVAAMGESAALVTNMDRHLLTALFVTATLLLQIFVRANPRSLLRLRHWQSASRLAGRPIHQSPRL
jgi:Mn2+/Fe2+ NRAMP family transporter